MRSIDLLKYYRKEKYIDEIVLGLVFVVIFVLLFLEFPTVPTGIDRSIINIFTLFHFFIGIAFGVLKVRPSIAVPLIVLWEPLEQWVLVPLRLCWPPEMLFDSLIDILVALIGYTIMERAMRQRKELQYVLERRRF